MLNGEVVQTMLDKAVTTLLGEKDVSKAWKRLISPAGTHHWPGMEKS